MQLIVCLSVGEFIKISNNYTLLTVRMQRVKIHREGTAILIILFLVLVGLNIPIWLYMPPVVIPGIFTLLSLVGYSFLFNFFRCPVRHYKGVRKNHVVSSVDGRVVAVERVREDEYMKSEAIMLSVFMSPLNVHANWYPVDGTVEYVRHHRGRFLSAYLPKASTENERSTVGIRCENGQKITARQIAGAMARRIVTYARKGMHASIDEHFGFIKLGSRVDLYLPVDCEILVKIGDVTRGGVTPVAKLKDE